MLQSCQKKSVIKVYVNFICVTDKLLQLFRCCCRCYQLLSLPYNNIWTTLFYLFADILKRNKKKKGKKEKRKRKLLCLNGLVKKAVKFCWQPLMLWNLCTVFWYFKGDWFCVGKETKILQVIWFFFLMYTFYLMQKKKRTKKEHFFFFIFVYLKKKKKKQATFFAMFFYFFF